MGQWLERKGNMNTKSFLFKMCSGLVASLFVLTLVLTGFSVYALRSLLYDQYGGKLTDAAEGVDHLMEIYEANALAHARVIAEDPQIVAALQSRDFQTMLAASAPLMKDGGLDYMVLTDPSGHALIRTHQPTKVPKADDSIASQQNVKEAMGGKAFVTLEEGKTVRLSVRAGAPVYDANHQLIGVVSTGYVVSKNEIAEMAKSMFGADMMAFLKGEMIATSLKGADGENLSEYEEKDEDLLQKVEGEGGKAVAPLSLAGKDYLAAYAPLKDADGNIIGMVAMANELSPITAAVLKTTLTSIAFFVLILVIATVLAFLYFRRMLAPIAVVQERLRHLAEGDLTQPPLAVTSEDELGLLAHECNEMSEKLAKVIKSVSGQADSVAESSGALRENSTQTADATTQIAESIVKVAEGTESQKTTVGQVLEAANDLDAHLQKLATNADEIAAASTKTSEMAAEGTSIVDRSVKSMTSLEQSVQASTGVIQRLGEQSREISEIVETISGIADQTNLLALNAAIEAARAGEQGRGFSVVADEVRKLAEQSSSAASKISTLIGEVQRRTDEAVASMKEGNEITVTSVQAVHEAGDAFGKIAGQIEMLSGHIEESVRAIRQAGEGGRQIVEAVNEIEKVADQLASETQSVSAAGEEQSATIEEIAAAASQLSHMADELKDIVRKFRLA